MQTIWMTGMSQSGKTTLANAIEQEMISRGMKVEIFDGDRMRGVVPTGFDFDSIKDHCKRLALQCSYMNRYGIYVIASVIVPFDAIREACKEIISPERFSLLFVDTPAEQCAINDKKGLWALAKEGKITNFAGVNVPFEQPDLSAPGVLHTTWPRDIKEEAIRIVDGVEAHRKRPASLFIGRWQPFHNGHAHIIQGALDESKRAIIGVRDMPRSESDPYSFEIIERCLWRTYGNQIEVMSIPDIESINIGRNVGYDVNEVHVPEDIKGISATAIRQNMKEGNSEWRDYVPRGVADTLSAIV